MMVVRIAHPMLPGFWNAFGRNTCTQMLCVRQIMQQMAARTAHLMLSGLWNTFLRALHAFLCADDAYEADYASDGNQGCTFNAFRPLERVWAQHMHTDAACRVDHAADESIHHFQASRTHFCMHYLQEDAVCRAHHAAEDCTFNAFRPQERVWMHYMQAGAYV